MAVDQQAQQAQATPRPKMTLGGSFDDGYGEFLGVVAIDTWESGERGWKWHLGVRPTDIPIQGETGCFHTWARLSTKQNSIMGVQRTAMMNVFDAETDIGEGALVGLGAWWKRETIKFGTNKDTGEEMKAEGVLIPLRLASPEDQERIAQHGGAGVGPHTTPAPQEPATDLGSYGEAIVALCTGKDRAQIQRAASARECGLPRDLKQGLISGTLLKVLVDQGLIEENSDGIFDQKVPF